MFKACSTIIVLAGICCAAAAQQVRVSPHETVSAVIGGKGGVRVTVYYGRPFSKDPKTGEMRQIWGKLVPWDQPWRMGADEATTLVTESPIMLGDKMLQTGAYSLYLVPSEKGPTKLAVSSKIGGGGENLDAKFDVARIDMKKDKLDKKVDQFTIAVTTEKDQPKGELKLMWDTMQFSVPITIKK